MSAARKYYGWLRDICVKRGCLEDWEQTATMEFVSLAELGREMRELQKSLGIMRFLGVLGGEDRACVVRTPPTKRDVPMRRNHRGEWVPDTRPSKLARRTGYRTDSERKRAARLKMEPSERSRIASLGGKAK